MTSQSEIAARGNLTNLTPVAGLTLGGIAQNGAASTYLYDAEGRRVQKVYGGQTTTYVYDAMGNLAAEYGGSDAPGCATCYLTPDHLGSTRLITGAGGNVVSRYDYTPFGSEINPSFRTVDSTPLPGYGGDWVNPKFTGKTRDYETTLGLDYFGARYFSAAQGRFTTPDKPFADQHAENPQSWNLYSYTRNNPLGAVDTDGEAVRALTGQALQRIQSTLPQDVRSQVAADKNGFLSRAAIDGISSGDSNVKLLQQAVDLDKTIDVTTAPALLGGDPGELVGLPFMYESVADQRAAVRAAGSDPSGIDIPTLYLGVTQSANQSASGNVTVTLSDQTGPAAKTPAAEQAVTAAHEIYGHALPAAEGKPWLHDNGGPVDKSIKRIEDHTRQLNQKSQ